MSDSPLPQYIRINATAQGGSTMSTRIQGLFYRDVPCKVRVPHPFFLWRWLGRTVWVDSFRTEEYWADASSPFVCPPS